MRNLLYDLRLGLRLLVRNPGFSAAAIVLLALGIGANTAIFSVVNAVLLHPLPYQDSSRIMQIWHVPPAKSFPGLTYFSVSPANYLDWRSQNHSFEAMAAYGGARFNVGGKERPEAIQAAAIAPSFFRYFVFSRSSAELSRRMMTIPAKVTSLSSAVRFGATTSEPILAS